MQSGNHTKENLVSRMRTRAHAVVLAFTVTIALVPAGAKASPAPPGHRPPFVGHGSPSAHPWESYNLSPSSRTIEPVAIYATTGSVTSPEPVLRGRSSRISGTGSGITFDFGKDVAGIVSLEFAGSSGAQQVGLAFSESSDYVGNTSDASTGGPRKSDGSVIADVNGRTSYTMPSAY